MVSSIGKAKPGRNQPDTTNKHKVQVHELISQIINDADVILEVLDARFIEKTRNKDIEDRIKKTGKKLVYIFNKSDLVDIKKIKSSQETNSLKPNLFFSNKDRKSGAILKRMIKIFAHQLKQDKRDVSIGIIGYPNTGKSSLINLLIGRKVARTSPEAGYTKGLQKVKITKGIYLIDTPGIVPEKDKTSINPALATKHSTIGSITWDKTRNPDMVIARIMEEYPNIIESHYGIDAKGDAEMLIEEIGKRLHYLIKGGEIDEMRTARQILKDWQEGKIRIN
ncbi:MAG: GTPase [Candidatus Pacearchaeota archaeon]